MKSTRSKKRTLRKLNQKQVLILYLNDSIIINYRSLTIFIVLAGAQSPNMIQSFANPCLYVDLALEIILPVILSITLAFKITLPACLE